jgi:serine/threonine-protein kinase
VPDSEPSDADRFLGEAQRRGLLTASQSQDCRRIAATLAEVEAELPADEIAMRKGWLSAAQVAEIRRALAPMRVGRYEVIGRIGEGAAGVVWKARDTKLDRVVALKVLSQKAEAAPSFRERFLREARIAVTLNHVNIVRGLDYGEADGYHYFAMEFVDGENAEQRLARLSHVPESQAVAMALDVVHALTHARKFQIVHRDVKPANLLIAATGHVKLGDLGLAKPMLSEPELLAGDGSTAGTPFYMSPEQIRAPETIDWKSDVYSLGATLYHLLTGQPPFRSDDRGNAIHKHLHERPRNPRELVLDLTDGVAAVVLRMLQKDPADRYASLEDLATDLECVLSGRPPLHTSTTPFDAATTQRHAASRAVPLGRGRGVRHRRCDDGRRVDGAAPGEDDEAARAGLRRVAARAVACPACRAGGPDAAETTHAAGHGRPARHRERRGGGEECVRGAGTGAPRRAELRQGEGVVRQLPREVRGDESRPVGGGRTCAHPQDRR